ncbi:MAG TPA: HNH endonuclease [Chloroflexota bacterium]
MSLESRFWAKVATSTDGCWLWTAARQRNGYGKIGAGTHDAGTLLAHRVAWELVNGPIPNGLCVLHRCDNPPCVRPDHLFVGTIKNNAQDMARKGRGVLQQHPERAARGTRNGAHTRPEKVLRGQRVGTSKLTWAEVERMRDEHRAGVRIADLARAFGVSWSNVKWIVTGKHWNGSEHSTGGLALA